MAHFCFGRHNNIQPDDELEEFFANTITNARKFTYLSLKIATNNFSQDRFIGRGCYGSVYRGVLPNGTLVAVKVMHNFIGIYNLLSMLKGIFCLSNNSMKHPNIDQAIGYSVNKGHLLLVSEYADNGNLRTLLFPEKKESFLNWHKRVAICIGIARGLAFLHEEAIPHVIHRDIKSSNILLDNNFVPKITGFDIAVVFSDYNELPLEEKVAGTRGYFDPSCFLNCEVTEKADVYSFGVVMLEIISGRKAHIFGSNGERYHLIEWASELVENDSCLEIINPLVTDFPTDGARRFIDVALSCINLEREQRPSMREVVLTLESLDGGSSSWRQPPIGLDMPPQTDDSSYSTYISAASSFRSSTTATEYFEDEGNTSISEGEGNVTLTEIESADSNTELQPQGEIQGNEASAARQQREQNNTAIVSIEPFRQQHTCPEAVYPPFRARVYQRYGSRNLYTF